jgi:hypothetical protein
MPLSHPAEDEERAAYLVTVQKSEQPMCVGDDSALKVRPAVAINVAFKCLDLEIVLDVNREGVKRAQRGSDKLEARFVSGETTASQRRELRAEMETVRNKKR